MILCYAGRSSPSAYELAEVNGDIEIVRSPHGDINWGRNDADTALNSDTSLVTNKRVMREKFAENDIPMPKLYSLDEAAQAIARGETVIGRPDRHTKGRGFWKISSYQDLARALRGTRKKKAATHLMAYIEAPREYRAHIFLGKSIRISEKGFGEKGKTSHGNYITRKPQHNVDHVRKAARKAVKAVGLDFGAVDVLADDENCWVLEVNSAPGLGGTLPRLYGEVFRKWCDGEWS